MLFSAFNRKIVFKAVRVNKTLNRKKKLEIYSSVASLIIFSNFHNDFALYTTLAIKNLILILQIDFS